MQYYVNRTVIALVSRGIASDLAIKLKDDGLTIATLGLKSDKDLRSLGLTTENISALRGSNRPKIPSHTVSALIFKNRFQCCVCRDPSKSVVFHHINPWNKSKDHSGENIAVLCLEHHERAHISGGLSKGLSSSQIKALKIEWEKTCANFDARSILDVSQLNHSSWLYFNHLRLFEIAREAGVRFNRLPNYVIALSANLIGPDGMLRERPTNLSYMYDDASNESIYRYVKNVLESTISRINIINVSDVLDKNMFKSIIVNGDFIFVQGAHTFKSLTKNKRGRGDIVQGVRRANDIIIDFVFDRWEATSCSAWASWLSGRQTSGSLLHVKDVKRSDGAISISCTVLAISNGHSRLKTRDYAPNFGQSVYFGAEADDCDASNWFDDIF